MLNPSARGHDVYDFMEGNVSDFYNAVDDAIVRSECVKGQYRITASPAYNSTSPVKTPNFTTLGISSSGPIVVDLENSYITATPKIKLSSSLARAGACDVPLFIGWKSSFEAIRQYDILVNSSPIYTQSFAGTESFIQDQILTELVKNTSPHTYTSYEQVQKMSPNVCGTYIKFAAAYNANTEIEIAIPIKILLSQFLILKNLKYLCSWMGKWELRVYFNWENLVVAPIKPGLSPQLFNTYKVTGDTATVGFTQVGDAFTGISAFTDTTVARQAYKGVDGSSGGAVVDCYVQLKYGDKTATSAAETITVTSMETHDVEANLATFQLRMDVNEELKARYSDKPLTFPVSTLQISRFSGSPQWGGGAGRDLNTVLCQSVNNCDTVFLLFPSTPNERTVFRNPKLSNLQLICGEYGAYPQQPINTYQCSKFLNLCGDALNVNSSPLTSFNNDTANSLMDTVTVYTGAGSVFNDVAHQKYDTSNFFVGIPFSIDDDFQGGLSSPSANINFKLIGRTTTDLSAWTTPLIACFLIDGSIMIKPDPMGETARVIYTDRTIC